MVSYKAPDFQDRLESATAAKARADKHAWLAERGYRVLPLRAAEIEADAGKVLDGLEAALGSPDGA